MEKFFKTLGLGVLYLLGLPFILLGLIGYALYLMVVIFITSIKAIILFFKGKKISSVLPEDIEAENIINNQIELAKNPQPVFQAGGVTYNINNVNLTPNEPKTILNPEPNDISYEQKYIENNEEDYNG